MKFNIIRKPRGRSCWAASAREAPRIRIFPYVRTKEMANAQPDDPAHRFEVRITSDSHFSWIRTRLSLERTLLAWERTAIALLGFGFTIVKFFEYLRSASGVKPAALPGAPKLLGLALIAASVIVLAISIWQYRWSITYLRAAPFDRIAPAQDVRMNTPALAVCIALMLIGMATFAAIIARVI
jgi:putative membrane protein